MQEKTKKKWPYVVLIVFLSILVLLYAYLYLFPSITESLTPTYIVTKGIDTLSDDAKCIVVRDEEVIYAQKSGTLTYYSKETEKTRKGFVVADVYAGNKQSYACPSTGFVSYYIDGYEDYFTPDTLGSLNIDDYKDLEIVPKSSVRNETLIGEPIYKLIKSNTWYLLLIVPEENLSKYTINDSITISLNETDDVSAKVIRFLGDGPTRAVVASTKLYNENFAKLRTLDVHVVTKKTEGLMIPTTSIATVDEKIGVYVLGVDDDYVFKEINVLVEGDEYTLISDNENIKQYDEILRKD